jgi:hypothetical protein
MADQVTIVVLVVPVRRKLRAGNNSQFSSTGLHGAHMVDNCACMGTYMCICTLTFQYIASSCHAIAQHGQACKSTLSKALDDQ